MTRVLDADDALERGLALGDVDRSGTLTLQTRGRPVQHSS